MTYPVEVEVIAVVQIKSVSGRSARPTTSSGSYRVLSATDKAQRTVKARLSDPERRRAAVLRATDRVKTTAAAAERVLRD